MSVITFIDSEIAKFKGVAGLLMKDLGTVGASISANILHDLEQAGGDTMAVMANDMEQAFGIVANSVLSSLSGGSSFQEAVDKAVVELGHFAWSSVIPVLVTIGETTLKTMATTAASMAIAGLIGL